jgi:hypothetical protein
MELERVLADGTSRPIVLGGHTRKYLPQGEMVAIIDCERRHLDDGTSAANKTLVKPF